MIDSSFNAARLGSVLEPTLYVGEVPGAHPLRRKTDSSDVVDVAAREVPNPLSAQASQAYQQVFELQFPTYRPGLVIDACA